MMFTPNERILQIKNETLVVGIDIGKETHYARAFDKRGIELAILQLPRDMYQFNPASFGGRFKNTDSGGRTQADCRPGVLQFADLYAAGSIVPGEATTAQGHF